ncbi:putative bifunctional diguanylate cyclase/phosphodiesterase [Roseibium litorale]|uniref:EAL domain-containing protein n=1 Tax=Roseibium litorale TaxID=2803841 RepID=A0ABR9CST6_9HYPH|nr:EAL domain-containing protein [Roseibium litorale]MBD8893942.1 EAL domain-containing protein [Roseibium litorale]
MFSFRSLLRLVEALDGSVQNADRAKRKPPHELEGLSGRGVATSVAFGRQVIDEALASRIRAAQIRTVMNLFPFTLVANIINILVVVGVLHGPVPASVLAIWVCGLSICLGFGIKAWLKSRVKPVKKASVRAMRAAVRSAAMLASFWAAVPVVTFAYFGPEAKLIISSLTTGMIGAGGFALASVPAAAMAWIGILVIGSAAALLIEGTANSAVFAVLLGSYSFIVFGSVILSSSLFVSRYLAEAEAKRKEELIALLLNEFEETASDWLWETDADGCLQRVSARFADVSGRSLEQLQGMDFGHLLRRSVVEELPSEGKELLKAFISRQSIHNMVVPIHVGPELRWWSLAARPAYDERGTFIGYRGVGSDVTEARRSSQMLEHMASHDSLTSIGNRSWFFQVAQSALDKAHDEGRSQTIFMIDLDNFKSVNDICGHPVGDRLLKQVAERLTRVCEGKVLLARIGGDEFAAIGGFPDPEDGLHIAQRIIDALKQPFQIGERALQVGATVGLAVSPGHGRLLDELMRHADMALYKAKHLGRGRALTYFSNIEEEIRNRRQIEEELRFAIELGQLVLAYQPVVSSKDATVLGYEALLRWDHPGRGLVSPAEFIPIAEETGLIIPIGEWVLRRACLQAVDLPGEPGIGVNLSPVQFMEPGFVETVKAVLAETGLKPERLVLEITESVLIQDFRQTGAILNALSDLGVNIALDDFGTGYSSLSYLRLYPFDRIKIDKSFVDEMAGRPDSLAIISTIISLAQTLGMTVTAEGVETEAQAELLRKMGCDSLQGYHFGRPVRSEELFRVLEDEETQKRVTPYLVHHQ